MEKKTLEGLTEEQISFQLILHSGNARSKLLQSLKQFREGHETVASDLLKEAEDDLRNAHDIHFQMVQQEQAEKRFHSPCCSCMPKIISCQR